jgi:hypothetical protein
MKLKRTFGVNLPHWEEALRTMIAEGEFSLPAAYPARSSAH